MTGTDRPTLLLMRGLPASGKTTEARAWVAADPDRRVRVNRDELRVMLHPGPPTYEHEREELVTRTQVAMVRSWLKAGKSVVVDDMNLRSRYARRWADLAHEAAADLEVRDVTTDVEECVRRDAARLARGERGVGEEFLRQTAARFAGERPPITRTPPRAPAEPPARYVPDESLPLAFVVDVDGTVALNTSGRSFYDYTAVGQDTPNAGVIRIVSALAEQHIIVFLSGREDSCRAETLEWLQEHVSDGIIDEELVMRPAGDHRDDAIIKPELFWRHVAPRYHVLGVLDDRNKVVAAWRELGLTTLQVADGNF